MSISIRNKKLLYLKKGVPLPHWRPSVLPAGLSPLFSSFQDTVRERSEMAMCSYRENIAKNISH
jgi:hypothetical protein